MSLLSVVIGYRDWGLDRLVLAIQSHEGSSLRHNIEIVVVDYGSQEPERLREALQPYRCQLVHSKGTKHWSRSRALNIGIRSSTSKFVLTTDADILFTPQTHEKVLQVAAQENTYALVQCRDLPQSLEPAMLQHLNFSDLERVATLRSREGLGGCACFSRSWIEGIRGYDERMEWWGAEDTDLSLRAKRTGLTLRWVESEDARIYHLWHPKVPLQLSRNSEFTNTLKNNRIIAYRDTSNVRNPEQWGEG